jgi:uncharacterized membrane protein
MRVIRPLSAVALLAATAACSSPLEPTLTPSGPRYDGGLIYMGSGTRAGTATATEPGDSAASRGSGYVGGGF